MSTYDLLIEKGEQLGIEKGIEKGISIENIRKTRQVVLNLVTKFPTLSNADIAQLAEATTDFVAQIKSELN